MAKLTAAARKTIPKSRFGVPSKAPASGSYPMPDRSHAANAMARASGKPVEAKVRAKAHELYPGIGSHHDHADHHAMHEHHHAMHQEHAVKIQHMMDHIAGHHHMMAEHHKMMKKHIQEHGY